MTPQELLTGAADIIHEHGWSQMHPAVDENNNSIPATVRSAKHFSAYGALIRAAYQVNPHAVKSVVAVRPALAHFQDVAGFDLNALNHHPRCSKELLLHAMRLAARS